MQDEKNTKIKAQSKTKSPSKRTFTAIQIYTQEKERETEITQHTTEITFNEKCSVFSEFFLI